MEFVDVNDGYGSPQFTLGVTAQSREWAIARGLIAGAGSTSVSLNFPPQYSIPAGAVVGATHTTDKIATISVTWFGYLEPA